MEKYLDKENCRSLLPDIANLPLVDQLENCLGGINDNNAKYQGFFRGLVRKNSKSVDFPSSADRLIPSPLNITLIADPSTRSINTRALELPYPGPCILNVGLWLGNDLFWRARIPMQFLLKGWGDANKGYQGYTHSITPNLLQLQTESQMKDEGSYYYVGITGRNWLQRLSEHYGEMQSGSRKNFHKAWRESMGMKSVLILSELRAINMTYDEAMDWEEKKVDEIASDQYGLNMIPGGFKGLRHLHKLGITNKVRISPEEREKAITEYVRRNPRKGIPNPFLKALWEDDSHYLKVIAGRPKTLTPDQVNKIRELNTKGRSPEEITDEVGALNIIQVKGVISGKTYGRIK